MERVNQSDSLQGDARAGLAAPVVDAPIGDTPAGRESEIVRRRGWLVRRMLLVADVVGLTAAFFLSALVLGSRVTHTSTVLEVALLVAALAAWVLAARLSGLYDHDEERADHSTADELAGVLKILTIGVWTVQLAALALGLTQPRLANLALFWGLAVVFVTAGRAAARGICRRSPMYAQNVVIVGSDHIAQLVATKIQQHKEYGMNLVGYVDGTTEGTRDELAPLPVLGPPENLPALVRLFDIERVVIAFPNDSSDQMLKLIRSMNDLRVQIDIVPRFPELVGPGAVIHAVEGLPLIGLPPFNLSRSSQLLKRGMDVVFAGAGLVVLLPLFILIAVAIKLGSRGPVFFRQVRMGAGGRTFRIHKFRTMCVDADDRKHEVAHLNMYSTGGGDGRMFKVPQDPRVTGVGRLLRRYSLDELPQLIDVVLGSMSLVGPRPLILDEDRYVVDWARRRLDLKPGMTGLWQVLGRNNIPFEEMTKLDYLYVGNWSPWTDVRLILLTLPALFRTHDAY